MFSSLSEPPKSMSSRETGAVLVDVEVGGHGGIITLTHSPSPPLQWPRRPHRRPVRGPPELNQSQGEMYISPDHAVGGHPSPSGVNIACVGAACLLILDVYL